MEEMYELARKQLRVAAERRKACYDVRMQKAEFNTGDWVWYYYPRKYQDRSPKWQKLYTGPYLVTRAILPVNYVLQKSARSKPFVVHVDKIKKFYGDAPSTWIASDHQKSPTCPESSTSNDQQAEEVRDQVPEEIFPRQADRNQSKDRSIGKQEHVSKIDLPRPKRTERQAPISANMCNRLS